jgi:hypothetical protein
MRCLLGAAFRSGRPFGAIQHRRIRGVGSGRLRGDGEKGGHSREHGHVGQRGRAAKKMTTMMRVLAWWKILDTILCVRVAPVVVHIVLLPFSLVSVSRMCSFLLFVRLVFTRLISRHRLGRLYQTRRGGSCCFHFLPTRIFVRTTFAWPACSPSSNPTP